MRALALAVGERRSGVLEGNPGCIPRDRHRGRLRSAYDRLPAMVALAAVAGVRVLAGKHAHGTLVEQAQFLHAAGVPAEDALAAACWAPRAYLGLPGIEPDAPAHLAIYASDPRSGLETLHEPELIVLAGRVIPAIHRS